MERSKKASEVEKYLFPYFVAKMTEHLREDIKTYSAAWEAAEGSLPWGIKTSISEDKSLEKGLNRTGWQIIQDMEAL